MLHFCLVKLYFHKEVSEANIGELQQWLLLLLLSSDNYISYTYLYISAHCAPKRNWLMFILLSALKV